MTKITTTIENIVTVWNVVIRLSDIAGSLRQIRPCTDTSRRLYRALRPRRTRSTITMIAMIKRM